MIIIIMMNVCFSGGGESGETEEDEKNIKEERFVEMHSSIMLRHA